MSKLTAACHDGREPACAITFEHATFLHNKQYVAPHFSSTITHVSHGMLARALWLAHPDTHVKVDPPVRLGFQRLRHLVMAAARRVLARPHHKGVLGVALLSPAMGCIYLWCARRMVPLAIEIF